jgi:apolipoprotein N-acyltransferase
MNTKHQSALFRSGKIRSASFPTWWISGLYLLGMIWLLLTIGHYSAQESPPWLVSAVVASTVSYGILMVLFWPFENVSPPRPERLAR